MDLHSHFHHHHHHLSNNNSRMILSMRQRQRLQQQHFNDLVIYRRNHKDRRNRYIHYIMIPLECWSLMVPLSILLGNIPTLFVGSFLALLSILVATTHTSGISAAFFHLFASVTANAFVARCSHSKFIALGFSTASWTFAWATQVGIGHFIMEKNQPNVANVKEVSGLAMALSVLIAWTP